MKRPSKDNKYVRLGSLWSYTWQYNPQSFSGPLLHGSGLKSEELYQNLVDLKILNKNGTIRYFYLLASNPNFNLYNILWVKLLKLDKKFELLMERILCFIGGTLQCGLIWSERTIKLREAVSDKEIEKIDIEDASIFYEELVFVEESIHHELAPKLPNTLFLVKNDNGFVSVNFIDSRGKHIPYILSDAQSSKLVELNNTVNLINDANNRIMKFCTNVKGYEGIIIATNSQPKKYFINELVKILGHSIYPIKPIKVKRAPQSRKKAS